MGSLFCKPCQDVTRSQAPSLAAHVPTMSDTVAIGQGQGITVGAANRDGSDTKYSDAQTARLVNEHRQKWGACEFPMPRDARYTLSYAPSMWDFWASDPQKKPFRRKPFMTHAEAPVKLAMEDYVDRRSAAETNVQPGHFNTTTYLGESGLVADSLSKAHRSYSLLNSRPKSGPIVTQCY
jgi:hypothetical protein